MTAKVLLVDDEPYILEEASEALIDEGYSCICVENVTKALKALDADDGIDLVVTDLKMPGESVADLIRKAIAQFDRDIKFILMSAHATPHVEIDGIDIDSYPFLRKPLNIDDFLEIVDSVLTTDNWQQNRDRRRR
jgi:DNA-binding NtrC family response regulator